MKRNLIKKIVISIIVVGLFAVVILKLVKYDSVKETIILATTQNPQLLTELYFENHLSLPDKIVLFKENKFQFTIHNLESREIEYHCEAYIDTDGKKNIISMDSILMKNDEYKTIYLNFTIIIPTQRSKVVVNLIDKNQQIFFWITEE